MCTKCLTKIQFAQIRKNYNNANLGEPSKKNYQTLDIVQTWGGGSAAQPNFLSKKGMDMF